MGKGLYRLGAWAFMHKWIVIGGWIVVIAILGLFALKNQQPLSSSVTIPGTEAQKTLDRFSAVFPDGGKGTGRVVVAAPHGKTIDAYEKQIGTLADTLARTPGVTQAVSPYVNTSAISKDRTIAYIQVQLKGETGSVSNETIDDAYKAAADARTVGLQVELSGDLIQHNPGEILGPGEVTGVVVALVVLVITLASLAAAGMPLATAIVAVGVSMAALFALDKVISVNSTTPVLAVMLGLAVGIDYSLFIISKYISHLREGYPYKTAVAKTISTAGNAVVFAASTVVIALAALSVVNIPFLTTMGLAGAGTIAVAAIVAITLVPALLGVAGKRVVGPKARRQIIAAQERGVQHDAPVRHDTFWHKWGTAVTRHPIVVLIGALVIIVVIALPVQKLTLGLPTDEFAAKDTTQRKAYDLLSKGFGAGFNGPLILVVQGLPAVTDADRSAVRTELTDSYTKQVAAATAVQQKQIAAEQAAVSTPAQAAALQEQITALQSAGALQQRAAMKQIDAAVEQYAPLRQAGLIATKIAKVADVAQAQPALATDNGTTAVIQVIADSSPSSKQTQNLIKYLRDSTHQTQLSGGNGITFGVTGSAALQADINNKVAAALPEYLAVVVGLSFILLVIAFRSILVPIKATLGYLLSVLAMFGALVAVFQWGWFGITDAPGPIVSFIPIIALGVLFGLAMDYEFFLVSSMREAYEKTGDARRAIVDGFGLGSKVVTAAAIIMVSIFAGFIFNHDAVIQSIGFGLGLGILIDAFLVRMTIVPAVMTLLGKSAWWIPKWLDKLLPHISIEGDE